MYTDALLLSVDMQLIAAYTFLLYRYANAIRV